MQVHNSVQTMALSRSHNVSDIVTLVHISAAICCGMNLRTIFQTL